MAIAATPLNPSDPQVAIRVHAQRINDLSNGRSNANGTLTLTVSTTSTTIMDRRVGIESVVTLMPTTAHAAAALATTYVSARRIGEFDLAHASNSQTDRTFDYAIIG